MDLSVPGLKNMTAAPTSLWSSAIGAEVFDKGAVLDESFRVSALLALSGSIDRAVAVKAPSMARYSGNSMAFRGGRTPEHLHRSKYDESLRVLLRGACEPNCQITEVGARKKLQNRGGQNRAGSRAPVKTRDNPREVTLSSRS